MMPGHMHSSAELASSAMLLSIVAVVVTLFYFVNNKDADVRAYSWAMVSSTISIFLAVTEDRLRSPFVSQRY